MEQHVTVELAEKTYDIVISSGSLEKLGEKLAQLAPGEGWGTKIMIISNPTVADIYADRVVNSLKQAGFQPVLALMADGEAYKSME
ncbi:MAG TPA: 3-dehydroquinate synthase, partial [Bacillota bacterium]|nr:3-dehydroquinate synthase [Bacillota bacterium]